MIMEIISMNGYGSYVWSAFSFTLISFTTLYFVTKLQHSKEQKKFAFKFSSLNVEKAKLSPSATLNYSKTENKDLSATVDEDEKETVKATVSWPIIQGGKNFSSIKKFKHKKEKNALLLKDKENEIKTQTATSWSFFQSAESVLVSTEAQLKAAEIANEGITLEYDSGNTRTTLDVIQSRSLLLNARIEYAKAERDFIISKFKLAFQLGTLSSTSIKSL